MEGVPRAAPGKQSCHIGGEQKGPCFMCWVNPKSTSREFPCQLHQPLPCHMWAGNFNKRIVEKLKNFH